MEKSGANFSDICTQARKIYGLEMGDSSNQTANPEIKNRIGLDSEPDSESEADDNLKADSDHGRDGQLRGDEESDHDHHDHRSDGGDRD